MLKRTAAVLVALASIGAVGLGGAHVLSNAMTANAAESASVAQQTRTFAVQNMTCALCPITVRTAMEAVEGVESVQIDLDTKTAAVVFDPAITTPDQIARASTNAGYPANAVPEGG